MLRWIHQERVVMVATPVWRPRRYWETTKRLVYWNRTPHTGNPLPAQDCCQPFMRREDDALAAASARRLPVTRGKSTHFERF